MSNVGDGSQTQEKAATTGSAKCGSSWFDHGVDVSRLHMNKCLFVETTDYCACANPDRAEYGDVSAKSTVSGAALIIDWRRRRCRDETVEESERLGALNLVDSTAPDMYEPCHYAYCFLERTIGCHHSPRAFIENGPAKIYKYVGSPGTSPTIISTPPCHNNHSPDSEKMTEVGLNSSCLSNGSPKKNRVHKHVTFSEPEISHVLITHEEPVITDAPRSPVATVEKPLTVRRYYLTNSDIVDELRRLGSCYCLGTIDHWTEMYYDTPASSLCSLECILMKDTRASKYWKFFSFAEDNIMEITTDEKELNEPLSRLVPPGHNGLKVGTTKEHRVKNSVHRRIIDGESVKPFFAVRNETNSFLNLDGGTHLKVTVTDYGFAWVVVERLCIDGERLADISMEMDLLAKELGLSSMADYDPLRYL